MNLQPTLMNKLFQPVVFLFLFLVSLEGTASSRQEVSIRAGEVKILEIKGIEKVAIGDPSKISYKTLESGQVMVVGLEAGTSSLHVWRHGGRELQYWFHVESRYVTEDVKLAKLITQKIPDLNVYSLDGRLVLEGKVDDEQAVTIEAVRSLVPDALFILGRRQFSVQPLVRVDAVLIEIGANDMQRLGIDWRDSMTGPSWGFHKTITPSDFIVYENDSDRINEGIVSTVPVGDTSFFQYFGITSHLLSTINLLESSGKARVLSSPKLTSISGKPATFHVGGSFPIPIINSIGAASVQQQNYGVILEVLPTVEGSDINLEVKVELSDIDPSVVVNGVPGTRNRNTQTVVQLQHNQTVAISGLFGHTDSNGSSGIPYLNQIPYLNYLFGVQESDFEDKEVVVLLTPKIITPGDEEDRKMTDFAKEMMIQQRAKLTIDGSFLE